MRRSRSRRLFGLLVAAAALIGPIAGQEISLPLKPESVRFAVIGDSGTGSNEQYEVGRRMAEARAKFPFDFVIMLGDNMYGGQRPADFEKKFVRPYKALLDAGVTFYAALGNHDEPAIQRFYKPFNLNGERYHTFTKGDVQFFVLDSNYMDPQQLRWIGRQLELSGADWKICYFHHPLYSSGARHGSEVDLRVLLEPLFVKYGVNVVFAGHEHFYERLRPQKGVYYFTSGGSARLRRGNIRRGPMTAAGFDTDLHFMLVEVTDSEMYFQVISRAGKMVDSGIVPKTTQTSLTSPRD